jgi:hypothetical protein
VEVDELQDTRGHIRYVRVAEEHGMQSATGGVERAIAARIWNPFACQGGGVGSDWGAPTVTRVSASMLAGLRSPLLALFDALILGAGYGILVAAGLTEVERLARPNERARLASIFYCLAYSGISAPYFIAALTWRVGSVAALLAAGGLAAATALYLLTIWRQAEAPETI